MVMLAGLIVAMAVSVTAIVGAAVMVTALWAGNDHDAWLGAGALGIAVGLLCAVGWAVDAAIPDR